MALPPERSETGRYLERQVDGRMLRLIARFVPSTTTSIIDVACGSGLYGPALAERAAMVDGLDVDATLTETARATGAYRRVMTAPAAHLATLEAGAYEVGFCSEFLEHVSNDDLDGVVAAIEHVVSQLIVVTVPNPRSPHFATDPTHILDYRVRTLARRLDRSDRFTYRLLPLGFSDLYRSPMVRAANLVARRMAVASPTVALLGERRSSMS